MEEKELMEKIQSFSAKNTISTESIENLPVKDKEKLISEFSYLEQLYATSDETANVMGISEEEFDNIPSDIKEVLLISNLYGGNSAAFNPENPLDADKKSLLNIKNYYETLQSMPTAQRDENLKNLYSTLPKVAQAMVIPFGELENKPDSLKQLLSLNYIEYSNNDSMKKNLVSLMNDYENLSIVHSLRSHDIGSNARDTVRSHDKVKDDAPKKKAFTFSRKKLNDNAKKIKEQPVENKKRDRSKIHGNER